MGTHAPGLAEGRMELRLMNILGEMFESVGVVIVAIVYNVSPGATGGMEMDLDTKEQEFFLLKFFYYRTIPRVFLA